MEQQNNAPIIPGSIGNNTLMAIIAYILFFVPLLTGHAKRDEFVKYHTKQGIILFILVCIINIVNRIMPFYFWMPFNSLLDLAVLVLLIVGIVNVLNNKKQPLPIIGKYADMLKF